MNEFNNENVVYQELDTEFKENTVNTNKKKKLIIIILIIIFALLIGFLIYFFAIKDGKLTSINVTSPDILYVDELDSVKVEAVGKRKLNNTIYNFEISDPSVAIVDNNTLKGKQISNTIAGLSTGKFILEITATLNNKTINNYTKEIVVCNKLDGSVFSTDEIVVILNEKTELNMSLGENSECYTNLTYSIGDNSYIELIDNKYLVGLKEGTTTITITDNKSSVTKTVNVIDSKNLIKITNLNLNKTSTTLYVGYKEQLKATVEPENATNKNLIWKTNNTSIVTVTNDGVIKGIAKGNAIVTVETEDGKYTKEVKVTVTNKVTISEKDTTAPKLTSVTIYSNNANKKYAKLNDIITIEVIANELLRTKPVISIFDNSILVTCIDTNTTRCYGTIKVDSTMNGLASINIKGYKDMNLNTGEVVTKTSNNSSVYVDQTVPNCTALVVSQDINSSVVKYSYNDKQSGLKSVIAPNRDIYTYNGDTENYEKEFTLPTTLSSTNYSMTITDMSGNQRICIASAIGLDNKPPVITVNVTNGLNKATLNTTITDNEGVVGYTITTSNITPTSWTKVDSLKKVSTSFTQAAGTYYIYAKDARNNISSKTIVLEATESSSCPCSSSYVCGSYDCSYNIEVCKTCNPSTGGSCSECLEYGGDCSEVCGTSNYTNNIKPNLLYNSLGKINIIPILNCECGTTTERVEQSCDSYCCSRHTSCYIIQKVNKD